MRADRVKTTSAWPLKAGRPARGSFAGLSVEASRKNALRSWPVYV